jgi:hypothetical protein
MRLFTVATVQLAALVGAQSTKVPGWFLAGSNRTSFAINVDGDVQHSGKASANLRCTEKRCPGFGVLMQTFSALEYRGRRLRVSAWVKAVKTEKANIWMRVDGGDATLTFDNMNSRQAHGTFDWRRQEIVLDVPDDGLTINYGLTLIGNGQAWVDDFVFEIVDKRVRSTNMMHQPTPIQSRMTREKFLRLPKAAVNADFELAAEM